MCNHGTVWFRFPVSGTVSPAGSARNRAGSNDAARNRRRPWRASAVVPASPRPCGDVLRSTRVVASTSKRGRTMAPHRNRKNPEVNLNLNVRGMTPSATVAINERCDELRRKDRRSSSSGSANRRSRCRRRWSRSSEPTPTRRTTCRSRDFPSCATRWPTTTAAPRVSSSPATTSSSGPAPRS